MMAKLQEAELASLRDRYLNLDFEEKTYHLDPEKCIAYARACGEIAPRFTDPEDPDFQALPTFVSSLSSRRQLPDDFPRFDGIGMDAGKAVTARAPIRLPASVTGRSHLHDIYTKTGRSGNMLFIVSRMDVYAADEQHLASADTRIVIRERRT